MPEPATRQTDRSIDVAIVGMGAVFPGAGDVPTFWRNLCDGVDSITDVPPSRWDPELFFDPTVVDGHSASDRFYCRRGGFVDDLVDFDPASFGVMPNVVAGTEPDQLLALRTAAEAIADAGGIDRLPDPARIGVIIGRGGYLTPASARMDQRVRTSHQILSLLRRARPRDHSRPARRRPHRLRRPDGPHQPGGGDRLGTQPGGVPRGQPLRLPGTGLHRRRGLRLVPRRRRPRGAGAGLGPVRRSAGGGRPPLPRGQPVERVHPAQGPEPEPGHPPLRPAGRRHADLGGHRDRRPQAPGRCRAGRRPGLRRHPGDWSSQRRPGVEPHEPLGRRAAPGGRTGVAAVRHRPYDGRRPRPPGGSRHRHPRWRPGRAGDGGAGLRAPAPARPSGGRRAGRHRDGEVQHRPLHARGRDRGADQSRPRRPPRGASPDAARRRAPPRPGPHPLPAGDRAGGLGPSDRHHAPPGSGERVRVRRDQRPRGPGGSPGMASLPSNR